MFNLYAEDSPRYEVIHHHGALAHHHSPQVRALLAQQVAMANSVIFSVPSAYYPNGGETGDERLLTTEVWREILSPFQIEELCYYGTPQNDNREYILCILRGQPVTQELLSLMKVPDEPYKRGITAIVLARNEERHIRACLESLAFCDERLVIDMQSEDSTAELAAGAGARVLSHPVIQPFDRARNLGISVALYSRILILDSDERAPPLLAADLRSIAENDTPETAEAMLPFRHHFSGHWMRCLYPGYTSARFFKNGKFIFNTRLHAGAQVDGRTTAYPAHNAEASLVHWSYDDILHYQTKQNSYTTNEASAMFRDGKTFDWREMLRHSLEDLTNYYDGGDAARDGPYGLIYSLLSANYRLLQHAKLFELRANAGMLLPQELAVPSNTREMAGALLDAMNRRRKPEPPGVLMGYPGASASCVFSGPILDCSGYGDESRNFLFAIHGAGVDAQARVLPWSENIIDLSEPEGACLEEMSRRPVSPGFTHIIQDFPGGWQRHPQSGRTVARTMFETDRLPVGWALACNQMDDVLVPSEFNRQTFTDAGVAESKIRVVPGCFDPAPYLRATGIGGGGENRPDRPEGTPFTFLSVFDWTSHKGPDLLMRAFLNAFEGRGDVRLKIKTWSTNGYSNQQILEQAAGYLGGGAAANLMDDGRIEFVFDRLSQAEMLNLYTAADAFVLPSHGEGWSRPYMEAMAAALPTIGSNWSGNTAFMTDENSYLIDCTVVPVPEAGWRELPTYKGHRWAEPNSDHLVALMRQVVEDPTAATEKGAFAQQDVCSRFNRETVAAILVDTLGLAKASNALRYS